MNKNLIVAIVLAVLVLLAVVQAFQISTTLKSVGSGGLSIGSASSGVAVATGGSGASAPARTLDSLPSMVGGC